ncbi:hypothetical protein CBM2600_A10087 [Cupriavidus taiwanensis]|nr:hypothetical protein CBM2600_A10087 [Cupriavidus taiwanensis]
MMCSRRRWHTAKIRTILRFTALTTRAALPTMTSINVTINTVVKVRSAHECTRGVAAGVVAAMATTGTPCLRAH